MESSDTIETGNVRGEVEESDSGDSLFLTQKSTPTPAAIPPICSLRSTPISPRFLESESSSEDEDISERRKKQPGLPKYNFPFLNQRKLPEDGPILSQNRAIHYSGVAGFFSCVSEMSRGQGRQPTESTLPMIDAGEITPLTEDEKSDEEDIKIIDKMLFVYSLKPKLSKSSQPWFTSLFDKIAGPAKPKRKSISQQHLVTKEALQSTPNLSNDKTDSSNSALIKVACKHTVNLPQVRQVTDRDFELSASDDFEDPESQSILQNDPFNIRGRQCDNVSDTNMLLSTNVKGGDEKLENENENLDTLRSHDSVDDLFEDHITNNPSPYRRKDKTPKKTNDKNLTVTKNGDATEKLAEITPVTKLMPDSCHLDKDIQEQSLHENTDLISCPDDEDYGTVKKKKKKKKKKDYLENADKELNWTCVDSLQKVDEQVDNSAGGGVVSERKKHKKKRKAVLECDEDLLKPLPLHNTVKNNSRLAESLELELANNDNGADCITTQSDESVSVRKRKKKKRQVLFVAETVENVTKSLSPSRTELGINTNNIESAEANKPVQESELDNKVKKKKRKKDRRANGELANIDENVEVTKMNECENCDSSEVIQPPSDEGDHLKKKRKKKKKDFEKTSPEDRMDSAILSPKAPDSPVGRKKKRQHCGREDVETEMEQSSGRKKHHKKICFENDDRRVRTPSHVEISPSSGRLEKVHTKVKKRLYNHNETFLDCI